MSTDLMLSGSNQPDDRRGLARPTRSQRAIQRRADAQLTALVNRGRHDQARATIRRRIADDGLQDIQEVGHLAQELADGDPFIAGLLIPIGQEFGRATAQDIRDFGRGQGA
jgi:hypothetical protein